MYIAHASVLLLRCTMIATHLLAQEITRCSVRPVGFAARVFLVLAFIIPTSLIRRTAAQKTAAQQPPRRCPAGNSKK